MTKDQEFSFETDTANIVSAMKVTGSTENKLFYSYQQRLGKFNEKAQAINAEKKQQNDVVSLAQVNQK
jgi:hypothetical protein